MIISQHGCKQFVNKSIYALMTKHLLDIFRSAFPKFSEKDINGLPYIILRYRGMGIAVCVILTCPDVVAAPEKIAYIEQFPFDGII